MKTFSRTLFLLFVLGPAAWGQPASDQKLTDALAKIRTACLAGQIEVWADYVYEPIAAGAGGREKIRTTLKSAQQALTAKKVKLVSLEFVEPFQFVGGPNHHFAVVPTRSDLSTPQGVLHDEGYQIAVQTPAGDWQFLDPTHSVPAPGAIRKLLPDFPSGIKLPEHKQTLAPAS